LFREFSHETGFVLGGGGGVFVGLSGEEDDELDQRPHGIVDWETVR
jgi:3-oxoacyl-(acyl-carrier-protein) synthase